MCRRNCLCHMLRGLSHFLQPAFLFISVFDRCNHARQGNTAKKAIADVSVRSPPTCRYSTLAVSIVRRNLNDTHRMYCNCAFYLSISEAFGCWRQRLAGGRLCFGCASQTTKRRWSGWKLWRFVSVVWLLRRHICVASIIRVLHRYLATNTICGWVS